MDCFLDKLDVKETPRDVYNTLAECGCCLKCILRFMGVKNFLVYATQSSAEQHLERLFDSKSNDSDEEAEPKRRRLSVTCVSCLGILSELTDETSIKRIAKEVKSAGYDAESFLLSVSTPVCLQLRQFSVLLHLKDKHPAVYDAIKLESISLVKEVWKWSVGFNVEKELGIKFNVDSPFDVVITFGYEDDVKECDKLDGLAVKDNKSKTSAKCRKATKWSRATIAAVLTTSNANRINRPPSHPEKPCSFQSIVCTHSPIYLAGRYNKYSRKLSQTPWLIDGVKFADTSVQELICDYIYPSMKPEEIVFSASGREDVDVRTLGRGRPFLLQVVNPRRSRFTVQEMKELSDKINSNSPDIAVRDLQVVTKNDTHRLKEGEEEKKKTYMALCYSIQPLSERDMDLMSKTKELHILQKSPIRVLHRRSAAVREKVIHSMKAERVDEHHFRLHLLTQAGTYIKEFVHGDFGRTKPNLSTLLDKEVDIVELDVESIELDWPPQLT